MFSTDFFTGCGKLFTPAPAGGVPLPSPGGRCRRSGGRGAVPGRFWVPPHTRQGLRPCHPLPGEGMKAPAGGRLPPRGRWTGRSPGRMRGAAPKKTKQATMNRERFHSTWPVFDFSVVFPHPSRLRRATFPVGEGFLRRGTPYLLPGEGNNPQISRKIPAVSLSVRGGKGLDPERGV